MKSPFLILAWMLACTARAAGSEPLRMVQVISLPGVTGRFDHMSVDAARKRLFVAALGNDTLEIIDLAAGRRLQSVRGMSHPTGVLFLPRANRLVVANGQSGTLALLDGASLQVENTLDSFPDADNLRMDSDEVIWLGYGEGALARIDPAAGKVLQQIKLPAHPESFQLEKGGGRIFVNLPNAMEVLAIDRNTGKTAQHWPLKKERANFPMALDESHHRVLVGCRTPPELLVLDMGDGHMVGRHRLCGDVDDLFYDSKRMRVYVSCGEGFVDVFQQSSADLYRPSAHLPVSVGARTSFFSAELDRYCVAVPARGQQVAEIRVFQPE